MLEELIYGLEEINKMKDYKCCYLEPVLKRLRNGEEVKLAVPIYDSKTGKWIHDLSFFTLRAERALDKALECLPDSPNLS